MIFRGFRLSCRREVFSRGLQGHPCRKEAPCKETQHRHAALLPPRPREARCVQSEGAVGHEGSLPECATETTHDDGHLVHRLRCVAGFSAWAGKAFRPHVGSTSSAAQGLESDGARRGPMDQGQMGHCSRSPTLSRGGGGGRAGVCPDPFVHESTASGEDAEDVRQSVVSSYLQSYSA